MVCLAVVLSGDPRRNYETDHSQVARGARLDVSPLLRGVPPTTNYVLGRRRRRGVDRERLGRRLGAETGCVIPDVDSNTVFATRRNLCRSDVGCALLHLTRDSERRGLERAVLCRKRQHTRVRPRDVNCCTEIRARSACVNVVERRVIHDAWRRLLRGRRSALGDCHLEGR